MAQQGSADKGVSSSKQSEGSFWLRAWRLGGLPLLLTLLGAANIGLLSPFEVPSTYTQSEQMLVTIFLFSAGVLTWGLNLTLDHRRWQTNMKFISDLQRQLVSSICTSVCNDDSGATKTKVEALMTAFGPIMPQAALEDDNREGGQNV